MAGKYRVEWSFGEVPNLFDKGASIEIPGEVPYPEEQELTVTASGPGAQATEVEAKSSDGYILELSVREAAVEIRAIVVEWQDDEESRPVLLGQILVGDPDGAGAFGGEQEIGTPGG